MDLITGASKETMNGVKFMLIYNAVSTFVETRATKRVKSKSIRQVAATNRCGYCLRVVDGEHEFYYFSPKSGISFARQIEVFVSASNDLRWQQDVKTAWIIPLDNKVYIAELERGEVIDESVLIVPAAQERITAMRQAGQEMCCLSGGACQSEISLDGIDDVPGFDLLIKKGRESKSFYFVSLAILMTYNILFHQAQIFYTVPFFIILMLVGFGYHQYQTEIEGAVLSAQEAAQRERIRIANANKERTSQSEANHSGSLNMLNLLVAFKQAQKLSGDGVTQVIWGRSGVELTGNSQHFPNSAAELGKQDGWTFQLLEKGWIVKLSRLAHADNKETTANAATMMRSLYSLAKVTLGEMQITKIRRENAHEIIAFSVTIPVGIPAALVGLSQAMRDKPYRLDAAICRFDGWRSTGCETTITAKYKI